MRRQGSTQCLQRQQFTIKVLRQRNPHQFGSGNLESLSCPDVGPSLHVRRQC